MILYADKITGSMERAMAETNRRREKQLEYNAAHGITPESVKSRIADILDSVYERDHVRADISQFTDSNGAMMGNNLKAHLDALTKQMRDAAADLDFERRPACAMKSNGCARWNWPSSTIRWRATSRRRARPAAVRRASTTRDALYIAPWRSRSVSASSTPPARRKRRKPLRGPTCSASRRWTKWGPMAPCQSRRRSLPKPSLDDMGPGTDMPTPAGAVSRSLFKKQTASEAHGSDFGAPGEGAPGDTGRSLFRKNSLDDMTVRRTEKPLGGEVKPVKRAKVGIGSYEDPADVRSQGRRSKKSGRPGH